MMPVTIIVDRPRIDMVFDRPKMDLVITRVGAEGKSAYEIAVEAGFTGTEAEFAARLVTPPGASEWATVHW